MLLESQASAESGGSVPDVRGGMGGMWPAAPNSLRGGMGFDAPEGWPAPNHEIEASSAKPIEMPFRADPA